MSRDAVLSAIRRGLRRGRLDAGAVAALDARTAAHPRHPIPARSLRPHAALVTQFMAYLTREFGTVDRLGHAADIPAAVAAYLARENLPAALVLAPHPALRALPWDTRPLLTVREGFSAGDDAVSLTLAFAGIAETGTLLIPSGPTRPTTLNLLPDTAIVVLPTGKIVGPYEDAWDRLRQAGPMPRTAMLITGPSRSADIEQTLELGAHGPRRLHVLLVDDFPDAP